MFALYYKLGVHHILDIHSYDHILFLVCLTAPYLLYQWKQILILITAFTVGHTTSLVLATFHIVKVPTDSIEFIIPLTIFITGLWNIVAIKNIVDSRTHWIKYVTALFFGLIHGLGFSNYLQSLLSVEKEILVSLLSFNLGIEVGQILIVLGIFLLNYVIINVLKTSRRDWVNIFSGAGMGVALVLMIDRFPW